MKQNKKEKAEKPSSKKAKLKVVSGEESKKTNKAEYKTKNNSTSLLKSFISDTLNEMDTRNELGEFLKLSRVGKSHQFTVSLARIGKRNGLETKTKIRLTMANTENVDLVVKSETKISESTGDVIQGQILGISSESDFNKKIPALMKEIRRVALETLRLEEYAKTLEGIREVNTAMENGQLDAAIVRELDNKVYHLSNGISSSDVKFLYEKTLAHYEVYRAQKMNDTTKAKTEGSALHCMVLEPQNFDKNFYVMPSYIDKRSHKVEAEVIELNNFSKEEIKEDTLEEIKRKAALVLSNENLRTILETSEKEITFFCKYNGRHLKAKLDIFTPVTQANFQAVSDLIGEQGASLQLGDCVMFDLKFLKDISPKEFSRDCGNYRFDISDAFYSMVVKKALAGIENMEQLNVLDGMNFITVEKGPVDLVELRNIDPEDLEFSVGCIGEGLAKLDDEFCKGYSLEKVKVKLPKYIKTQNYEVV